jgi:hypothetical protein
MTVSAVYEFPAYIWVMRDALEATYPTGYGPLTFNVVMPRDAPGNGAPPPLPGVDSRPELAGEGTVWTHQYGAHIPESLKPATALHRIGIRDVVGPSYEHQPWSTPCAQLAEYITRWFDDVRTWVEIATGQDLDPNHRVYDAEVVGHRLAFIEPEHDGALGFTITTPRILPLRAKEWAVILKLVRAGNQPPLEEVLSRDARAAHRRHANRRAIIDAATALEIALGRHIRTVVNALPEEQRGRIEKRTTLGGYVAIAKERHLQLAVSIERLRWLVRLRNDAAHRGAAPGDWDAGKAVQVVIDFLGTHGRYPSYRQT